MKTKLDFIILCMFFFAGVLGYSSDTPPSPGTPNNNIDSYCNPCGVEEAVRYGAGSHGPLGAIAEGRAWKDGTEFKWRAKAMAKNTDTHMKGEFTLFYGIPHTRVVVKIGRDDLVDVDADPYHFGYTDGYEGKYGAVFAIQSTRPFTIQNAITEVNNTTATSLIHGKPLSDNDPNSANTHECSADLPYCICDDGNGEGGADNDGGGADNGGVNNNLGISVADSDQTYQPGDSITLNVVTSEPYYDISLYAHTPWDTSSSGTYQSYAYGDGTSTETSFSYTFPSGSMYTGDFLFRAVIYRWSDMSSYEETYTVTVSNPTTPSHPLSVSASLGPSRWSVSLSWNVPSSDGGSAITGYQYQYRRYYAGTWESWSSWQSVSSTFTTVTGLISNGTYEFRVRAVNNVGTGSITDSVTTTAR